MQRKKRGFLVLIVAFIVIIIAIGILYILRDEQRKNFDKLINSNIILKIDYGIIPQEKKLIEKNALFKKVFLDNYYYLIINEDNILFTYYLDWYYSIDPMQGYNLTYKKELTNDVINKILDSIQNKTVDTLKARIKDNYVNVEIDGKEAYIEKIELQYILQDNGIMLDI